MEREMMTYDGEGIELGLMTLKRAIEKFGKRNVKLEKDTMTITVNR